MNSLRISLIGVGVPLSLAFSLWHTPASKNNEGNRLYLQGEYREALGQYAEVKAEANDPAPLDYNIGNSLYKLDRFEQATTAYLNALRSDDPTLQQRAFYNLGNAYFRQGKLLPAIESYQEALLLNSSDRAAKRNLEIAQKRLEELEKQASEPSREEEEGEGNEEEQGAPPNQGQHPGDEQPKEQQAEPSPQPEQMTPEEALRLLQALEEQEKATLQQIQAHQQAEPEEGTKDW